MHAVSDEAHRAFLNRYYGASKYIYDATRKYYLFGRDAAIDGLARDSRWSSLVEIGPGTGRNLVRLHARRPFAALGGIDASDEMLSIATRRCPWAMLTHGFAETARIGAVLGRAPDRVFLSYCLTMVQDPEAALANARASVSEHGEVVVVDFADLGGLPRSARRALGGWLRTFHVEPQRFLSLLSSADRVEYGPARYYAIATFRAVRSLATDPRR